MFRVVVLDDHPVVGSAIEAAALHEEDIEYAGTGTHTSDLHCLLELDPDVLLLDLRLADDDGIAVCDELSRGQHPVRVLVFTAYGSTSLLARALSAGASGYLLKDVPIPIVFAAIRHVGSHGSYIDPRLELPGVHAGRDKEAQVLTSRETDVLRMIVSGARNREIATELYISPHTVKFHVSNLMTKFGVRRRTELVRIAAEQMLI